MGFFSLFRRKTNSKKPSHTRRQKQSSQFPSTSAASQQQHHIIAINPKAHQQLGTDYPYPIQKPTLKPSQSSKASSSSSKKQRKPQPHKSQISAPQITPFPQRDRISASIDPQRAYHSINRNGYTNSYQRFPTVHPPQQPRANGHGNSYDVKPLPPVPPMPPPKVALPAGKVVQNRHQHGALGSVRHWDQAGHNSGGNGTAHQSMKAEIGYVSKQQAAAFRPLSDIGKEARGWAEREMGGYFDEEVRRGSGKGFI